MEIYFFYEVIKGFWFKGCEVRVINFFVKKRVEGRVEGKNSLLGFYGIIGFVR